MSMAIFNSFLYVYQRVTKIEESSRAVQLRPVPARACSLARSRASSSTSCIFGLGQTARHRDDASTIAMKITMDP